MSVLVDTSVLAAFLNVKDPDHDRAMALSTRIFERHYGEPLGTDTVLDEGLTLLHRRFPVLAATRSYAELFWGNEKKPPRLRLTLTDEGLLRRSTSLYFEHHKKRLSFTDCTLLAHAEATGAKIATFDKHLLWVSDGIGE